MNRTLKLALPFGILLVLAIALVAQQPVQLQTVNGGGALALGHGTAATAIRVELPTDGTGQIGLAAGSNAVGTFQILPQSTSTYAPSNFDLAATAATNVKGSGGNVWSWQGFNPNTSTCYLQFYNSVSATLGTSPLHPYGVVAGGSFNMTPGPIAIYNFSTGISTGQTTTPTGSTPCASPMTITIQYQ